MALGDQTRKYRPGTIVFREGESGDYACLVRSGAIDLVKLAKPDAPPIATVNPGMMFGELALIDNAPRMATARATVETELMIVDRAKFLTKLKGLNGRQRELFDLLTAFVREMPLWVAPVHGEARPPLSEKANRIQALLASPALAELLKTGDPFLDVLGKMLVNYSKRRLPPPA